MFSQTSFLSRLPSSISFEPIQSYRGARRSGLRDASCRRPRLGWGKEMWFAHKAVRVAVSLALVAIVTAILWRIQMTMGGSHQFIYFYLFPVIWIRMLYSDALAA